MNLMQGVELVTLMVLPSALMAAALTAPRAMAAVEQRMAQRRRRRCGPWTYAPPIEQIAADLRRLLRRHEDLVRDRAIPLRAHRLEAVELAIASCIDDAERALGVASAEDARSRRELGRRLHRLAAMGLVLPRQAPLLADDEAA